MAELHTLQQQLQQCFAQAIISTKYDRNELTIEVEREHLHAFCLALRDDYHFEQLMDVCGVDYLEYGVAQWETGKATGKGFDRGVDLEGIQATPKYNKTRFAVVYHLLSISKNLRIRVRTYVDDDMPMVDSVNDIWEAANWFEREAFDMFGILFTGHPDLRRILTDYGFVGHPFRKDFPLSGEVEVRYDAKEQRVIYEPVDIEPRVLVPKIIRHDNRYEAQEQEEASPDDKQGDDSK